MFVSDILEVQAAVVEHDQITHRIGIERSSVFEPSDELNRRIALNITPYHSRQVQWHILKIRREIHPRRVFDVEVGSCCVWLTDA